MKAGKSNPTVLERRNYKWCYLFLLPSLLIFLLFYLSPILTVIATSFTKWDGFNKPVFIGLKNYIDLFSFQNLSHIFEKPSSLVRDCRNFPCGIRRADGICTVCKAQRLEIHQSDFYGA